MLLEQSIEPKQRTGSSFLVNFDAIVPVDCPCGVTRRALADDPASPLSIHRTDISTDAKTHYHKRQTEVYYVLECAAEACIELDGDRHAIRPGMAVHIPPGTRHRAIGEMKVLVVSVPRFDPADEWFD